MPDRDLILGVLGVQAGFVTPTQVMSAASAILVDRDGPSFLTRLEQSGGLTPARRALLEAMVEEPLVAAEGDSDRAFARLNDDATRRTLSQAFSPPDSAAALTADAARAIPEERPQQYTRIDELGRGGQSVVWRALDEFVGREVALKELLPPSGGGSTDKSPAAVRRRFLREARLTAQLDHPSIVAVHELARRPDGTLFCAQKLIRGETLKARLARCETLQQRLALLMHIIDACHAVAYAHSRGVIHRDLKPSNIMVGAFGETVVVDWGLAKKSGEDGSAADALPPAGSTVDPGLTVAGVALGTPGYMSPEQARGAVAEIDERSDVFSLGAILYELLTGHLPFEGVNAEQMIDKAQAGRFPPVRNVCPEAPAELAAVAERALSPDPGGRYPGAESLADELLAFRMGGRVTAYEYRSWDLLKRFVARNRSLTSVSAAALLVFIIASVTIARQLYDTRRNLAASFLERARNAEASSDWGRAAGYYAASRTHNDTREGRWGVALAHEKMPRRLVTRRGSGGSFTDVVYLPDGRALAIALEGRTVMGRQVDGERELWRFDSPQPIQDTQVAPGQVHLRSPGTVRTLDAATGKLIASFTGEAAPCITAKLPTPVMLRRNPGGLNDLVFVEANGGARVLQSDLSLDGLCAMAPDGDRAAVQDREGTVHLWDLRKVEEVTSRHASDASQLLFTAHGVAMVRSRSLQLFGGGEGDFYVGIPGRGGNGLMAAGAKGAVSPDGHLVVIPRLTSNQADVIDLRLKSVVASLAFAAGAPRFAISPSNDRLLIGGLGDASLLTEWDLSPQDAPHSIAGSPRMGFNLANDASRILVYQVVNPPRFEVYDAGGALLRRLDTGPVSRTNGMLSADGKRFAVFVPDTVSVRDVDSGAIVGQLECAGCMRLALSTDGARLAASNGKEVVLWDVVRGEAIWRDGARPGTLGDPVTMSDDGRSVVWTRGGSIYMHTEGAAGEREIRFGPGITDARMSHDGTRLASVNRRSIAVWSLDGLRPVFRVANPAAVYQEIKWSRDDSALINMRDSLGTVLLDSATGERFASISVSKPAALGANELVSVDLRTRIVRGDGVWAVAPLPRPDDSPPEESLARVLADAGLEMQGVELVYSAPAGPAQ